VLLRGVNTTPDQLLDLCFTLLDYGKILPYYFYMCDMIPNAEHWRLAVRRRRSCQFAIVGYLPGFATPRFVCDVPFVASDGSTWSATTTTSWDLVLDEELPHGHRSRRPRGAHAQVPLLRPDLHAPEEGQRWWRDKISAGVDDLLAELQQEQGITVDA
jgi:lysine 2,3-aminomutase